MLNCIKCGSKIDNFEDKCYKCGSVIKKISGFLSFAPNLANENENFPKDAFENLVKLESNNFWFRVRNKIIVSSIKRYCGRFDSLLEVGCGTGFVLQALCNNFKNVKFFGSELYISGLIHTSERIKNVKLFQMDACNIPFEKEFDLIGIFDVLEHINEDVRVLENIYKSLSDNGFCVITVPQHAWLWSRVDELALHKRRYTYVELKNKIESVGFKIIYSTSFVSLLLPIMLISRILFINRNSKENKYNELNINKYLNKIFEFIMLVEYQIIRLGFHFSIGGSRLVIIQKPA